MLRNLGTKILKENKTLTLQECIALDAVQKGHQISEETAKELLDKGLIEGESPNYQISLGVAKITHQLPEYTRVSGLERSKLLGTFKIKTNDTAIYSECR